MIKAEKIKVLILSAMLISVLVYKLSAFTIYDNRTSLIGEISDTIPYLHMETREHANCILENSEL